MSLPVFIGDEVSAQGYRLAGLQTLIPGEDDLLALVKPGCEQAPLVLIDAGCEYDCYASDITRTFPVNGRFSDAQKTLYKVVLAAQEAAIR